jgi:ATP-dependent Clp protease ATP-binding subunit ClpC
MKAKGSATQWLRATTRVEKALQDAHEYARRTGDYLAQPDHVLLALIEESQSLSTRLLVRMGVSPQELRAAVAAREGHGGERDATPPTEQAWTDNRFNLLYAAREEARGLGDTYVGTEHLLLSLLREGQPNSQALLSLGVTWERVAEAVKGERSQASQQRSVAAEAATL